MKLHKRIFNKIGVYRTYAHEIDGKKYKIPIHRGLGYSNFENAEPWMSEVLQKLGRNDCRFLDVGVNVGQTLLKWKAIFPESTYVGFEPNKNCVVYVRDMIEKNDLKNCVIHPYGISTEKTEAKLYLLGRDPGDSSASTIADFRKNQERTGIPVELIPLNEVEETPFDFVKIDVEGGELEVLRSVFELGGEPTIICEILPVYTKKNTERLARQKAIENLLKANNYCIYRILKGQKIELKKLDQFNIHGEIALCDYIFVPQEKASALIANFN